MRGNWCSSVVSEFPTELGETTNTHRSDSGLQLARHELEVRVNCSWRSQGSVAVVILLQVFGWTSGDSLVRVITITREQERLDTISIAVAVTNDLGVHTKLASVQDSTIL